MTAYDLRTDDWASLTGALGGVRDKHSALTFASRRRLCRAQLTDLHTQEPIVARVCDQMADEVFRTPWEFDEFESAAGLAPAEAMALIKPYKIEQVLAQLFRWGSLYGGAAATIPVHGLGTPDTPLVLGRPAPLYKSKVMVADDCQPYEVDVARGSETYGEILTYQELGPGYGTIVHATRLLVYEPIPLPLLERRVSPNGWGPSVVERLYNALGKDGAASSHAVAMMYIASILWTKIKGFRNTAKTKEGKQQIREMLELMRAQLDSLGVLGLDSEDEIGNLSLAVTGAHELMDRMRDRLASASPMPREILFKESPTGLRGGELTGPQALWYGTVDSFRRDVVEPLLDRWLRVFFTCRGLDVQRWTIKWAPLWVPTQGELAQNQLVLAQADQIRIESGPATPSEVREHRFVKGSVEPLRVEAAAPVPALALPGPEDYAAEAPGEPADVAAEAMDGAQISSLVEVASNPALTREQKIGIISVAFPSIRPEQIQAVVGPVPDPAAAEGAPLAEAGDMVKVQEAAARLGVATRTITRLGETGAIKVRGVGAHAVVSLKELWAAIDKDGDGKPDAGVAEPEQPTAAEPAT